MNQHILADLDLRVRARYPLIALRTPEEARALRYIDALMSLPPHARKPLYHWSRVSGLRQVSGPGLTAPCAISERADPHALLEFLDTYIQEPGPDGPQVGIFVLRDFGPYLAPQEMVDPLTVRWLRELARKIEGQHVTLIFLGATFPQIPELEKEVFTFDLPLPDEDEVNNLLTLHTDPLVGRADLDLTLTSEMREHLVAALLGLTEAEIKNTLAMCLIRQRGLSLHSIPLIIDEKKEAIRRGGALTYTHPEPVQHLGGYPALRQILEEAAATFSPAARAFGVRPHKGLLLVGLPGVGKDLTKRIAAGVLGRPLLDLDFGALMGAGGGVLGSAERAIRGALERVGLVRGILGLSEYEKATAGLGSSDKTDGGTTARMVATLLNWMQEQEQVFVVATANDVRGLPPEQLRQGRFGQVLFMDVPRAADRQSIFAVHLARIRRDPTAYDLAALAGATEGFSGAEIEGVVRAALGDAFRDGARALTTADLLARARRLTPVSVLKREEVESLRAWAREHGALDVAALGAGPSAPTQPRTAGLEL